MSSLSQRHGGCGHMMAGFHLHSICARCRDKKKAQDPCVEKPGSDFRQCNTLSPEQLAQFSTPSYKIKKEKCEAHPCGPCTCVSWGVMDGQSTSRSPSLSEQPSEKKKRSKKIAATSKPVKPDNLVKSTSNRPSSSSSTDHRIEELHQKLWQEHSTDHRSLPSVLSRSHQPMLHQPIWSEPFLNPSDQPSSQQTDRPFTADLLATDPVKHRSNIKDWF